MQPPQPKQQQPQTTTSTTTTATTTTIAHLPHEERLRKAWRTMGTSMVQTMAKADALDDDNNNNNELDKSVILFLRARIEFHRLLGHVEAKLQGKAEEMESLDTYIKTQPKWGKHNHKRKRDET
jgi:hypothetical protein